VDCISRQNVEAILKPILKHHSCGRDVNAPCDHWTETIEGRRRESETDLSAVGKCYVLMYLRSENKTHCKANFIHVGTVQKVFLAISMWDLQ
jgi:hypothetical protein